MRRRPGFDCDSGDVSETNVPRGSLRHRIAMNVVGWGVVLSSAVSVFFSFFPIQPAVNCYPPQEWSRLGVAAAIGCGLLALAGWLVLLRDRRTHDPPIGACGAGFLTIVIVFGFPAALITAVDASDAPTVRSGCEVTWPLACLIGATVFTVLVTIAIASVLARFLPPSRWRLPIAGASGVLVWAAYVLLLRPF
jgi:hypothetical protein